MTTQASGINSKLPPVSYIKFLRKTEEGSEGRRGARSMVCGGLARLLLLHSLLQYSLSQQDQSLSVLLSQLDNVHECHDVIPAADLLSTAINSQFPRLIPLAKFFADHPKDFDASFLENSSFDRFPPLRANLSSNNPYYALEYTCDNSSAKWVPTIVFSTRDPNATNRQAYLTLRMEFDLDLCESVSCNTKDEHVRW
uniref:Fibronectin type-III domain-containing protein n=1 Tax=Heterorhabditis bacteriophora TaxID=37862 RepID=A0A1I7WTT6_HETBA